MDAGVETIAPRCGHCGAELPATTGAGRKKAYCNATCRSRARRDRTPPAAARCAVRAGIARCASSSSGAWYDQRGQVVAHTCGEHRELAEELLRAAMPRGQKLDRWLPANVRWTPPAAPVPVGKAFQLRVTLAGVHPAVWRRIHLRADTPLSRLHDVLQVAMGWQGFHLWRFGPWLFNEVKGEFVPTLTLEDVMGKPGNSIGYLYDFGDEWEHVIELEKIVERPRAGTVLPRCSAGKRACPPEDCGGPWGYEETLKALRSRKGWRYRQARELCGTKFDAEAFDKDTVNVQLTAFAPG